MGTWTPTSTFWTWSIGDLWKFVKTGYNSNKALGCETLLYMIHGVHDNSQGGVTMLGVIMPNPN
jgi:hypothetical protein